MYVEFWGNVAKVIIIIFGGIIGLAALTSHMEERIEQKRKEERWHQYEEELEQEKQQLLPKIKDIGVEMLKDQRFIKLIKDVAQSAKWHEDELHSIYVGSLDIEIRLQDKRGDKWTPIQRGSTFKVYYKDYNIALTNDPNERITISQVILSQCKFLTYHYKASAKDNTKETQSVTQAHFSVSNDGERYSMANTLYKKGLL